MKTERILAGVDLGPDTEKILAYAALFAEKMAASLSILYVIDYLTTPPTYLAPYIEEEKKLAAEQLKVWEERLAVNGHRPETEIVTGRLHETFEAETRRVRSDMLVLGFRRHVLRRSSSEKLIKGLQMPMLVVRGERTDAASAGSVAIRKILCPVDMSEVSAKALSVAKELQAVFSATLDVLHVLPSHWLESRLMAPEEKNRALKDFREQAGESLNKFLSGFSLTNIGLIAEGEPYGEISSFSARENIDLIVIGARGLSHLKEMLIGSVTDAVLKSSPCPVLVIH